MDETEDTIPAEVEADTVEPTPIEDTPTPEPETEVAPIEIDPIEIQVDPVASPVIEDTPVSYRIAGIAMSSMGGVVRETPFRTQ